MVHMSPIPVVLETAALVSSRRFASDKFSDDPMSSWFRV